VIVRQERVEDIDAVGAVVEAAFRGANPHGKGEYIPTEHLMIAVLRRDDALTLGLVAEDGGTIVGHIAFSPVLIDGRSQGWHGLAPLAVRPDRQRTGIGASLVREGLVRLTASGSKGCVVLGDPNYYSRFGFGPHAQLRLEGVPPQYFMAQSFADAVPSGVVTYHDAFTRPHTA
jgi:putative acetyltransferase